MKKRNKGFMGISFGRLIILLLVCFAIQHTLNFNSFVTIGTTEFYNNVLDVGKECASVAVDFCNYCKDVLDG